MIYEYETEKVKPLIICRGLFLNAVFFAVMR